MTQTRPTALPVVVPGPPPDAEPAEPTEDPVSLLDSGVDLTRIAPVVPADPRRLAAH